MNLLEIERVTDRLGGLLQKGADTTLAPQFAGWFSAVCRETSARLRECETLINSGDVVAAVTMAEEPPALDDVLARVATVNVAAWNRFCEERQLPAAAPIDPAAAATLRACYGRQVPGDHPFYAQYRNAVLTRDREKALRVLRGIVRLNPSDSQAATELERLDGRVLAARLQHLDAALERGDPPAAISEQVQAIEAFAFRTRPVSPGWNRAQSIRCGVVLDAAESLRGKNDWVGVLERLDWVEHLRQTHALTLEAPLASRFESLRQWARSEQAKDRQQREFDAGLKRLRQLLELSEEKDTAARKVPLAEIKDDFEALHKVWRALEQFTRPIPEDIAAPFRKRTSLLGAEIARRTRLRLLAITIGVAMALVAGGFVVSWGWTRLKAREYAGQLDRLRTQRQVRSTEKLLEQLRVRENRLRRIGSLNSSMAAAESFVLEEHRRAENFDGLLAALPREFPSRPDGRELADLKARFTAAQAALQALAGDLHSENEPRLAPAQNAWEGFLATQAELVNRRFETSLREVETRAAEFDYAAPLPAAGQLSAVAAPLAALAGIQAEFTNTIPFRRDLVGRFEAVRARTAAFQREWDKVDSGLASLKQATATDRFLRCLDQIRSSEFSSAPAVRAAEAVRRLDPGEDSMLAALVCPGKPELRTWFRDHAAPDFIPPSVMPAEKAQWLEFSEKFFAGHFRYVLYLDPQRTNRVTWITLGPLSRTPEWLTIPAYSPEMSPRACRFLPADYGYFDGVWRLSPSQPVYELETAGKCPETAAFTALDLKELMTPDGERYRVPLLRVLDALKDSREGSPLFRAYLFLMFTRFLELQPEASGLVFAPAVRRHRDQLLAAGGNELRENDWFAPDRVKQFAEPFETFFASIRPASYWKQARALAAAGREAFQAGLEYAGFIDLDSRPYVRTNVAAAEFWGYNARSNAPALLYQALEGTVVQVEPGLPLSPLFVLKTDRAGILARAGVAPDDPVFGPHLPPLFAPKAPVPPPRTNSSSLWPNSPPP